VPELAGLSTCGHDVLIDAELCEVAGDGVDLRCFLGR
jgi:hypothetical protein